MADKNTPSSKTRRTDPGAAARRAQQGGNGRVWWLVGGAVVVVGLLVVIAAVASRSKDAPVPTGTDAAAVIDQVTSVPASVTNKVGIGSVQNIPAAISDPALTADGKPEVLYIGAEYCPYCATERWAMVEALSRFGTFKDLSLTHSATADVFPDTPTFTFNGSTYTSPYITFTPVETASNVPDGNGGYKPLDAPTQAQADLLTRLGDNGSIPFIDVGGKYVISGATYDPQALQGKSASEIAAAMHDPTSDIAKGAVGSANMLTAMICDTTDNKPANVCTAPAIKEIQSTLK